MSGYSCFSFHVSLLTKELLISMMLQTRNRATNWDALWPMHGHVCYLRTVLTLQQGIMVIYFCLISLPSLPFTRGLFSKCSTRCWRLMLWRQEVLLDKPWRFWPQACLEEWKMATQDFGQSRYGSTLRWCSLTNWQWGSGNELNKSEICVTV